MYIKWIVCKVKEHKKQNFAEAQEKWESTSDSNGFIAQTGGWDLKNKNDACIISFWESKEYLEAFMQGPHDEIIKSNKQINFYNEIFVEHFKSIFNMEGEAGTLKEAVEKGNLLRIADCIVQPEKIKHFEKMQSEIWLPGMRESKGMLGGAFSKNDNHNLRYLVSTFWDNIDNHTHYTKNRLSFLQNEADVSHDITKITGRQILLVSSWIL